MLGAPDSGASSQHLGKSADRRYSADDSLHHPRNPGLDLTTHPMCVSSATVNAVQQQLRLCGHNTTSPSSASRAEHECRMSPTSVESPDLQLKAVGEKVGSGTGYPTQTRSSFHNSRSARRGSVSDYANRRKHGDVVTFAASAHKSTNVCYLRKTCVFCSFARLRRRGSVSLHPRQVYAMRPETAGQRV